MRGELSPPKPTRANPLQTDPHGHLIPKRNGAVAERTEVILLRWACGVPAVISSVSDRDAAALREIERVGLGPGVQIMVEAEGRTLELLGSASLLQSVPLQLVAEHCNDVPGCLKIPGRESF